MSRFFAVAKGFEEEGINLPQRSTEFSAGYDFEAAEDIVVPSIWKNYTDILERKISMTEVVDELGWMTYPEYFDIKNVESNGFKPSMIKTGIKASMGDGEVLYLYNRSSNPKVGLILANSVGLIDKDYFENTDNDGHIFVPFFNFSDRDLTIKKGQRVAQGVFSPYLTVANDTATGKRTGGLGSTGR